MSLLGFLLNDTASRFMIMSRWPRDSNSMTTVFRSP